ncbi:MAG: universal stress protein [Acidimicrobiia bacterium]|nr:universal stress protein [Acidimicrobiia bacterium]
MHVVIATAGALPPGPVADFVASIWQESFRVSVMTAIQVPRDFLDDLDTDDWSPLGDEEPATRDDAVATYIAERGARLAEPILAGLDARGISASPVYVDGSDPADAIVATAEHLGANLIVMGATKKLFEESSWTSISAQVVDRTRIPTLVIPGARADQDPDDTGD